MEYDYDYKFAYKQHFGLSSSESGSENEETFQKLYGKYEPPPVPIDPDKVVIIQPEEPLSGPNERKISINTIESNLKPIKMKSKSKKGKNKKTISGETPVIENVQSEKENKESRNSLPYNQVASHIKEVVAKHLHQTIADINFPAHNKLQFYGSTLMFENSISGIDSRVDQCLSSKSNSAHNCQLISSSTKSVNQEMKSNPKKKKKKTKKNNQLENQQVLESVKLTFVLKEDDFPPLVQSKQASCIRKSKIKESNCEEKNYSQMYDTENESEITNQSQNFLDEGVIKPELKQLIECNFDSNSICTYETSKSPVYEDIIEKQNNILDNILKDTSFDFLINYYGFYNNSESEKHLASYKVENKQFKKDLKVKKIIKKVVKLDEACISENTVKTTDRKQNDNISSALCLKPSPVPENIVEKPKTESKLENKLTQNKIFDSINVNSSDDISSLGRNDSICRKHCCSQITDNLSINTRDVDINTDDRKLSIETNSIGIGTSDGEKDNCVIIQNVGCDMNRKGIKTPESILNMSIIDVVNKFIEIGICDDELHPQIQLGIQLILIYLIIKMFLSIMICAVDNMIILWILFLFRFLFR
ncbi:uncharacterized protein LOC130446026 isoform X1 [Diorhabda sublineata]|uniref:uncharacterized protein LOC130446026 isoform X1 n=2 Tax=Diorhabda sublineata TaxID=1163346 RepID=UPI0024E14A17|nr:uncharacterized protein LOC130446026 isoform X1 [Diorhabda sublineata]